MFVKPAEGRTVRRPDTLVHLVAAGEHVPDGDEYWVRRLRDGDVVEAGAPVAEEVEAVETTAARATAYEFGTKSADEPDVLEETRS